MIYRTEAAGLYGRNIPNIYVQSAVISNNRAVSTPRRVSEKKSDHVTVPPPGATACHLTLAMKDVYSLWINRRRVYETYKIKVVRCIDERITNEFTSYHRPRAFSILRRIQELDSVKTYDISLADFTRDEISERTVTQGDDQGNSVKSLVFEHYDYGLPDNLKHLTYFVFVYGRQLEENENLGQTARDFVGMCYIQKIIDGGVVPKTTALYNIGGTNSVWAGPIHKMPNGQYHTGATHSSGSRALSKNVVQNTKIKDLRFANLLNGRSLRVPLDQPRILTTMGKQPAAERLFPVMEKNAVFTDLFSSIDTRDNIRHLFGINMRSLATRYSKFGLAVPRMPLGGQQTTIGYTDLLKVVGMTIRRRRVDPATEFNTLFSHINGSQRFDKKEIEEIIYSAGPRTGGLSSVSLDAKNASSMRFYTVLDRTLREVNYGKYQYVVELKVADTSDIAIASMISQLELARAKMLRVPTRSRHVAPPFRRSALREYANIAHTSFLLFGSANSLSAEQIYTSLEPMVSGYRDTDVERVVSLFDSLIVSLRTLISMDDNIGTKHSSAIEMRHSMSDKDRTSKAEPPASNITTVEHVFQNEYDPSLKNGTGYDYLGITKNQERQAGLVTISKEEFLERVELETTKFFSSLDVNMDLMANNRNYTKSDSLQKTDVQFFTPTRAKIFNTFYKFTDPPSPGNEKYREFEKDVFRLNVHGRLTNAPPKKSGTEECGDDTQRTINASFSIHDLSALQRENQDSFFQAGGCLEQRDMTTAPSIDEASVNLDPKPKYVRPPISPYFSGFLRSRSLVPPPAEDCSPRHCAPAMGLFSVLDECNDKLLDQEASEREATLKKLPNQIKSLLLGSVNPDISNLSWMFDMVDILDDDVTGPTFRLNFYGLHKVEALVEFASSSENTVLSRVTKFVPLTREIIENIPTGSNLLCRLVSYTNKDFSLTGLPNNLKLPIYNKHFLIRGSAPSATPPQATARTMGITRSVINGSTIENSSELEQYAHSTEPTSGHQSGAVSRNMTATFATPGGY
jgi:hypothetical protein